MSQRTLVAMNESLVVSVAVTATRPTVAGDGVDITGWRANGIFAPPLAALFIDGTIAQTVDAPTGGANGAELWGYRLSQWWRLGYLNDGAAIEIAGGVQGYAQEINILGIFERLAVAGTPSAGTTLAKMAPIDHWTGP